MTVMEKIAKINNMMDEIEEELISIESVANDTEVYVTERTTEKTFEVGTKEDAKHMRLVEAKLDDLAERFQNFKYATDRFGNCYYRLWRSYLTKMEEYFKESTVEKEDEYI